LLGFESFKDSVDDSVSLFYCGVAFAEAKLMGREEAVGVHMREDTV
jgi:hypothetical protein